MPTEYALHLSEALCREKSSNSGLQLKDSSGHMRLEGWIKQPRSEHCIPPSLQINIIARSNRTGMPVQKRTVNYESLIPVPDIVQEIVVSSFNTDNFEQSFSSSLDFLCFYKLPRFRIT